MQNGRFHLSAHRGYISLLEKMAKDPVWIANWCPFSLMNVDYKIFAKIIATRIQKAMSPLIHPDQSGFMQGRYIGENLLEMLSTIEYCNEHRIEGLIVSFDFEKAFDRVEWDVLDQILQKFNFGPNIRSWIKILQTDMESAAMNNGLIMDWFEPQHRLRQGCNLSPVCFTLLIEVLGEKIRSLHMDRKVHAQFADNLWLGIKFKQESFNQLLHTVHKFCEYSSLKINYSKTVILRISPIRLSPVTLISEEELK